MTDTPSSDYRSNRMPSADGHGSARADVLALFVSKIGLEGNWSELDADDAGRFDRAITPYARYGVSGFTPELVGFWLLWHAEGGFEGMRRLGMSETTIWRRVRAFRDAFGIHPDDYELPGVSIDLEGYWFHPDGHGFMGNKLAATDD